MTGAQASINATTGTTCVSGATVSGNVTVAAGASVLLKNTTVGGTLTATGAEAVQVIGSTVTGAAKVAGSTKDVTIAGSTFKAGLSLTGNTQVTANERFTRLAGAYGPILAGSTVNGTLECSGNSADVKDFGAENKITGGYSGCALAAVTPEAPGVRHRPGHAVAHARRPGRVRRVHARRHEGVHDHVGRQRHLDGRRRDAVRERAGPPDQRRVHAGRAAAGGVLQVRRGPPRSPTTR